MRSPYLLITAGVLAALSLGVLVLVLIRAADDDSPAAPETPSATSTATATSSATPTGDASPTATPAEATATPTTEPSATPTTSLPATGQLIEHGNRGSDTIALTFDMGGRVDPALDIMNWLIANEVHATIFMTGAMAANQNTDAGRKVLELVDAHPELFSFGNHSYTHPDFRNLTVEQMHEELRRTEEAVARTIDRTMLPWFRPPLGGQNQGVVEAVAALGYTGTVMWDIDTIDWRPEEDGGPTASDITDKVVSRAQGGSIVLMHLGGFNTLDALPAMLAGLEAKGLTPVTLDEMFGH